MTGPPGRTARLNGRLPHAATGTLRLTSIKATGDPEA